MVNKKLLQKLNEKRIIDRRQVLWWQLGFEGRKIYSEKDFNQNLKTISYEVQRRNWETGKITYQGEEEYQIWTKDEVPILFKNINLFGLDIPCFITVKPMSHPERVGDGWYSLKYLKEDKQPLSEFHRPHIRGVVVEETKEFLFWNSFLLGRTPDWYQSSAFIPKNKNLPPIILDPIHPSKFYNNLIEGGWSHGRRPQKKPKKFDNKDCFNIIPYYDFRRDQPCLILYPAPLFKRKLDFPVIIKNIPKRIPKILGTGYISFGVNSEEVFYWEINAQQERAARKSLINRLGTLSRNI